jgi:hypothetical protein
MSVTRSFSDVPDLVEQVCEAAMASRDGNCDLALDKSLLDTGPSRRPFKGLAWLA